MELSLAGRVRLRRNCPTFDDPRCQRIADAKVGDLARDARLRGELARIAHASAMRRWNDRGLVRESD
jgi:hypothetical protein